MPEITNSLALFKIQINLPQFLLLSSDSNPSLRLCAFNLTIVAQSTLVFLDRVNQIVEPLPQHQVIE